MTLLRLESEVAELRVVMQLCYWQQKQPVEACEAEREHSLAVAAALVAEVAVGVALLVADQQFVPHQTWG